MLHATMVLVNGQVLTVDGRNTVQEGLAIYGDRIVAVGSNAKILAYQGSKTEVVDLVGRAVLPGLIDAHAHLWSHGLQKMGIDCTYSEVSSIGDIQARIEALVPTLEPGQWVRGWGYDETYLEEKRHPNRFDLDRVCPNNPVFLRHVSAHIAVLNSKGLEQAGVDTDTPDPEGGLIERDQRGRPTGVLYESANYLGHKAALPTEQELREALGLACRDFLTNGVTSVHDAWGLGTAQLRALAEMNSAGELKLRVYEFLGSSSEDREQFSYATDAGLITGFGDSRLRVGPVKRIVDGDPTASTAATRKPYPNDAKNYGFLYYDQDALNRLFSESHDRRFQMTAHASGDRAIEMVLNAIEASLRDRPSADPRPRIEHCALLDPELMKRLKQSGVIPVPQPVFFYDFGDRFLRDYGEQVRYLFPLRSLLEMGIPVAASSDCPVASPNPLLGIYEAMTRETRSGQVVSRQECVTLEQAIRMYTINGAHASFEEDVKGSLEPGKLADVVVLSGPILRRAPQEVRSLDVDVTIVGGEVVFQRAAASEEAGRTQGSL